MLIVDANECEPCSVDVRYCNAAGFACGSHGCRCDDVVHNGQPNDSEDEESTMDDTSAASAMEAFTAMLDALHKLHSTLGKRAPTAKQPKQRKDYKEFGLDDDIDLIKDHWQRLGANKLPALSNRVYKRKYKLRKGTRTHNSQIIPNTYMPHTRTSLPTMNAVRIP